MLKHIKLISFAALAVAVMAMLPGDAQAQSYSCANPVYGVGGSYATYTNTSLCTGNNTANQAPSVATATAVLGTASSQTASLIANRIANSGSAGSFDVAANGFTASSGIATGNGYMNNVGVWLSGSWNDVEDDNTDTRFDGDVYAIVGGIDFEIGPQTILGLSVGYEDVDLDTAYNGFNGQDGNLDGDGYTIAPYLSHNLNDNASVSLTAGYSDLEYDTLRYDPVVGTQITGSTDADRYFIDASVNGIYRFEQDERWSLRGKGSVFYASEDKDDFNETEAGTGTTIAQNGEEVELGQFLLDGRLGFKAHEAIEPYALVGMEFDFTKDEATVGAGQSKASFDDEDFGAKFGGGVNLDLGNQITGGVEAYTVEFRDDYEQVTITGNLRIKF